MKSSIAIKPQGQHFVRIIGGKWRRMHVPVPESQTLRPTPDRVKETLFNWLGQELMGWHCLDAFAGTGALGLEAASRGAASVQFIEQDSLLVQHIRASIKRLGANNAQVHCADAISMMLKYPVGGLDLVFLDPPFTSTMAEPALEAAAPLLNIGGYLYLETPNQWNCASLEGVGLSAYRHLKAGAVHAHLFQKVI